MHDALTVKLQAQGQWVYLLSTLGGIDSSLLDGRHHPCPKCGGTDRFRCIDPDLGGLFCNQCFNEKNGDGISALQWLTGWNFKTTVTKLGETLGIPSRNGKHTNHAKPERSIEDALHLAEWDQGNPLALIESWCQRKGNQWTSREFLMSGGRLASYIDKHNRKFAVAALPVITITNSREAIGWAIEEIGCLPFYFNSKKEAVKKKKVDGGSNVGWVGLWGIDHLENAEIVWKVEGESDMLALLAVIPDDRQQSHVVLTNAGGCSQNPGKFDFAPFGGKTVYVVGDADKPGQEGASKWASAFASQGIECRIVQLPYEIEPSHGKDLRDWLADGHTYQELLSMALGSNLVGSSDLPILSDILEHDDDPDRLARLVLGLNPHTAYWREEWYFRAENRYRRVSKEFVRAEIHRVCDEEFAAISREEEEKDSVKRKVTTAIVSNVEAALKSRCVIRDDIEMGTWIEYDESGRVIGGESKDWISTQSGILKINELLGGLDYLEPHSHRWFSNVCLPYPFDISASCPIWNRFLERNLEADEDRISLLQQWAGYLLTPSTDQQKFLILEGEGSNGKSVYLAAIEAMLAEENCSHVPLEIFGQRFALTQTLNKLANIAADCGEIDNVSEGYLKSFTSGDRMMFDRKGISAVEASPTARLMLSTNNRPRFSDKSGGLWRRMLLVPFQVEIQEGEKVVGMDKVDWWRRSGELPGILNWAIYGLQQLRANGRFTIPESVKAAVDEYRSESNPARVFLLEHYEASQEATQTSDIYKHYKEWCTENGYKPLADRSFSKELKRCFPKVERRRLGSRSQRMWCYQGVSKQRDIDLHESDGTHGAHGAHFDF